MSRTPPQAVEVEETILGSMMIEKEAVSLAVENISKSDFYNQKNALIFETMLGLYMNNEPVDILTVEHELTSNGLLDKIGSSYIADLTRSVSSAANIEYHCTIVREKALLRKLIQGLGKTVQGCFEPSANPYTLSDDVGRLILDLEHSGSDTMDVSEVMQLVAKSVDASQNKGDVEAWRTGLSDLDRMIVGFEKAKLYIIAARPSMGKTALALSLMRRLARDQVGVGILSLETSSESIGFRLVSSVSGLSIGKMKSGKMRENELSQFLNACNTLSELKIAIDDTAALSDIQLKAKCRKLVSNHDCKVIFVDYLQLLSSEGVNREREIAQISRVCKIIAKEMDIAVVALAQLSRAVEQRGGDKKPQLSDLRDSGQIEQDADVVMFLYRPEYYGIKLDNDSNPTDGILEIIIAKQKDGQTGIVKTMFVKEKMSVENLHNEDAPF